MGLCAGYPRQSVPGRVLGIRNAKTLTGDTQRAFPAPGPWALDLSILLCFLLPTILSLLPEGISHGLSASGVGTLGDCRFASLVFYLLISQPELGRICPMSDSGPSLISRLL